MDMQDHSGQMDGFATQYSYLCASMQYLSIDCLIIELWVCELRGKKMKINTFHRRKTVCKLN